MPVNVHWTDLKDSQELLAVLWQKMQPQSHFPFGCVRIRNDRYYHCRHLPEFQSGWDLTFVAQGGKKMVFVKDAKKAKDETDNHTWTNREQILSYPGNSPISAYTLKKALSSIKSLCVCVCSVHHKVRQADKIYASDRKKIAPDSLCMAAHTKHKQA